MSNPSPSLEELRSQFSNLVADGCNVIPISLDLPQLKFEDETPPSAFLKIRREGVPSFLLESAEIIVGLHTKGKADNVFSIIGTDPFHTIRINDPNANSLTGDPLQHLEKELAKYKSASRYTQEPDLLNGGAVGYIGYDCIRYFEPKISQFYPLKDVLNVPESLFLFVNSFIVFDHRQKKIKIVALCPFDSRDESLMTSHYEATMHRIEELRDRLLNGNAVDFTDAPSAATRSEGVSNVGREGYEGMVRRLKERIVDGDIIQAVPSQRVKRVTGVHPFNIYKKLRVLNPSRYMFYIDLLDFQLVGASPELLVKVHNGIVVTHPIAGTRARGASEEEDERLASELINDEKERAEHIMLVDLGRNDVNRVAEPNSTKVDSLMHIERYSHVMHIVSQVSGQLRRDCTPFDAFRSIFPAGTVSGAPKIKAMELISKLEGEKRGIYAGAVGYFSFSGNIDTCIALRTMVTKDGAAYLQAGGGIVYDSEPYAEYIETVNKMAALARAIDDAEDHAAQHKTTLESSSSAAVNKGDNRGNNNEVYNALWKRDFALPTSPFSNHYVNASQTINKDQPRLLLIDNYDSFTWNLYQYLCQLGQDVIVYRNDKITVEECLKLNPDKVVISPGPSWPKDAGISSDVIRAFTGKVPVLGVCLGHECMAEVFGGIIEHCGEIVHGKTSPLKHDSKGVYANLPQDVPVIRYHSLAAPIKQLPDVLEATSFTDNGIIMGLRHKKYKVEGVQFHPESIKTEFGMEMLKNFVEMKGTTWD